MKVLLSFTRDRKRIEWNQTENPNFAIGKERETAQEENSAILERCP